MNAERIYFRKFKGLDTGVWTLLIITMVLSLGLFSFFILKKDKCTPFTIIITPNSDSVYYTNISLIFSSSVESKNISWNFGDKTDNPDQATVSHKFLKEGKYTIRATMNAGCDATREIVVITNPNEPVASEDIIGLETVTAGKEADYLCAIYGKTSAWEVEGHPELKPQITGLKARFRFQYNGNYTLKVTLDGDRVKTYYKEIIVTGGMNKPGKPEPLKPLIDSREKPQPVTLQKNIIGISTKTFKDMLLSVVNNEINNPEDFDKYLYLGTYNTKVQINGQGTQSFRAFFNMIAGMQNKIVIDNVSFVTDPDDSKKINLIKVQYKKIN